MYIKQFHIKNFRSINELTLNFNKGVNIIIGENNSGKTAVIDALRICLSYGSLTRDIYVNKDRDFFLDSRNPDNDAKEILFDLIFQPENADEQSTFIDMIRQDSDDSSEQTIELHFRYFLEEKNNRTILRWRIWGGENEGQQVPIEALQLISHTYLSALRDATEKLRPHSYGNKIASLYRNLKQYQNQEGNTIVLNKEQREELAKGLKDQVEGGNWKKVVESGNNKVLEHIKHSTIIGKHPNVEFSFLPYTYNEIVDNIEARKPVYIENAEPVRNQKYFTVKQNGLGENNIIYAGTVLGDLIDQEENDEREYYYNALLIEEPEAHLHPQKQNTFFEYLSSLNSFEIQIFITSHSPTVTAKANLDYITVLQRKDNQISAFSLTESVLETKNKKYLSKFLDVTKSQLFFANGVILVEGISEALLLPVFSKIIQENLEKNGVEIVNLNGVAFEHFAKLFNSKDESKRMLARCTLLTDDDRGQISKKDFKNDIINENQSNNIFKILKEEGIIDNLNRIQSMDIDQIPLESSDFHEPVKNKLTELINKYSARAIVAEGFKGANLGVMLAKITFEYELMVASPFNMCLIHKIYKRMHPRLKDLDNTESIEIQAYDVLVKLYSNKDKSELAHQLAVLLEEYDHLSKRFIVPDYIVRGIKWVTKGEV